jgi:23S rRNA pseudouridine1911/1915/1917 synthase
MTRHNFAIPDGITGERADVVLAGVLGLSRSKVQDALEAESIKVNGKVAQSNTRVYTGDWVVADLEHLERGVQVIPTRVENLSILYEDSDLVVVNKPAGIASHPSLGWDGPDVLGALAERGVSIATSGASERQGIVQRLDVGTSGCMVLAKSEFAYSHLKDQFRQRSVSKIYHALIQGRLDPSEGTIDAPIARHPQHDYKFAVMAGGRDAITHYRTIEAMSFGSLVEVELETGRTHQIRVHFSALRHPCIGDEMYGADPTISAKLNLSHQWLHALRLEILHPTTGERITFHSPYPDELESSLETLRNL